MRIRPYGGRISASKLRRLDHLKKKALADLYAKQKFIFELKVAVRKGSGPHTLREAALKFLLNI